MAKDANGHGREPEIDPERTEALCNAVRVGTSLQGASKFAGIPEDTLYGWIRKGRKPDAEPVYRGFVAALDEALAYFEVSTVHELRDSKDTRALRWLLAVRWPDRYSEKRVVEGQVLHRHEFDFSRLEQADLETLRGILAKAQPDGAPVLELELVAEEDEGASHENGATVT